jgi:hypothetical protein
MKCTHTPTTRVVPRDDLYNLSHGRCSERSRTQRRFRHGGKICIYTIPALSSRRTMREEEGSGSSSSRNMQAVGSHKLRKMPTKKLLLLPLCTLEGRVSVTREILPLPIFLCHCALLFFVVHFRWERVRSA